MTTGRMLSRKAIAYLADLLSKTLRVYDLRTILDKLELPRSYASGFYKHEALANFNGFGNGFRDFITKLKKDGILRDIEKDIIGKIHGYLCSFESTHYGPKPNKEQALYALILTQHTLLFLSKIISSKWKNSEWWKHAQIRG